MKLHLLIENHDYKSWKDYFSQITLDILAEMSQDDLRAAGIEAFGIRHKLIKAILKLTLGQPAGCDMPGFPPTEPGFQGSVVVDLPSEHPELIAVEDEMQSTIVEHRDGGSSGGTFTRYRVLKVQKIFNRRLWERYCSMFISFHFEIHLLIDS